MHTDQREAGKPLSASPPSGVRVVRKGEPLWWLLRFGGAFFAALLMTGIAWLIRPAGVEPVRYVLVTFAGLVVLNMVVTTVRHMGR